MKVLSLYNKMDLPETRLLIGLKQRGIETRIFCDASSGYASLLSEEGMPFEQLVCRNRVDFAAIARIRRAIKEFQPDIVHSYTSRTLSVSLLASIGLSKTPVQLAYRGALGNISRFDPSAYLTYRNPRVDGMNCVSDAIKDYCLSVGIPERKLKRIYKGHKTHWYKAAEPKKYRELNIDEDAIVVSCVANMRPNKGVRVLLEAADLLQSSSNIHFLIVGSIDEAEVATWRSNEEAHSNITFTGMRTDAASLVGLSDIFVMPTRFTEGFPKAVIEAMSQGIAPIVTNIGGMPEIVEHQKSGLIIKADSAEAIAEAIVELSAHPVERQKYGTAAKQRIEQAFDIENSISETENWYQSFLP